MEKLTTYVAFDLEFHKKEQHTDGFELLQVSAVKMVDGAEVAYFDSYVYTDKPISSFIHGLTGITVDHLKTAPRVETVLADFSTFVGDSPLIGYSGRHSDLPILITYGLDLTSQYRVDVYDEAYERRSTDLNGIARLKLQRVADFLGIKGRGHNSLEDARMTAKVYEQFVEFDRNREFLMAQEAVSNNPFAGLDLSGFLD